MMKFNRIALFALLISLCSSSTAFLSSTSRKKLCTSSSLSGSPQVLTDFMARAHEEKLRAMKDVESKYKNRIEELEAKLAEYENGTAKPVDSEPEKKAEPQLETPPPSPSYFYFPPATNKELTQKVKAYQDFISKYIVNAQIEKVNAVKIAEQTTKEKYEAIIQELKEGEGKDASFE